MSCFSDVVTPDGDLSGLIANEMLVFEDKVLPIEMDASKRADLYAELGIFDLEFE